mgnify:CR=1 FL=1
MHTQLRIIRLVALARLRSAGWVPWLLAIAWVSLASFQEPLFFRRYGIDLVDDAAWIGGAAVLLVLLLTERRLPRRCGVAVNLVILAAISVLQSGGAYMADLSPWPNSWADHLQSSGSFFLAWAPLSLTLCRKSGAGRMNQLLGKLVVLCALLMGSMLAVALRSSPSAFVVLSSALAFLGAACWASGRSEIT